jgi:hypothetical protein
VICEKSKIFKNFQKVLKSKKTLNNLQAPKNENRCKNALFIVNYVIKRFFFLPKQIKYVFITKLASSLDFDEPSTHPCKNAHRMTPNAKAEGMINNNKKMILTHIKKHYTN